MIRSRKWLAVTGITALLAGVTYAENGAPRPALLVALLQCRSEAESLTRLACYDKQVDAIDQAEKRKDLVVVDRQQVTEARRTLFGFPLPKLGLFGGGDNDKAVETADIDEIESVVLSARPISGGNWSLVLDKDGGTWETTSPLAVAPRKGDKIIIRKAALGSYKGNVGPNRIVRFRRVG